MWSFDHDETQKPPPGFEIFVAPGDAKTWIVAGRQSSPSAPNTLGIYQAHVNDGRPAALVLSQPPRLDARVAVSCTMASPRSDTPERRPNPTAACGVVARFQDAKNYYLAAANAHDHEVNLYAVKSGNRTKIGGAKTGDIADKWLELAFTLKGDTLSVSWAGTPVLEMHDKTFTTAGGVGLWTFVNSLTEFDDFSVTNL